MNDKIKVALLGPDLRWTARIGFLFPLVVRQRLPESVFAIIAITAIVNVFLYSSSAATPLPLADAWFFLESVIPQYFSGHLSIADLFVQRGAGDHAQPLQKIILLFHTHFFGMDFRIEGLIGVCFAVSLCWIAYLQMNHGINGLSRRLLASALSGTVFAVWLSLNANNIYTWSLVTIGFLVQAFAFAFIVMFVWAVRNRRFWFMLPAALALGLVIDEVAIITIVAAALASLILGIANWRSVLTATALSVLGLLTARILLSLAADELGTSSAAIDFPSPSSLFTTEAWKAAVLPLFNSLIYVEHLHKWHPENVALWIAATTGFSALLHIYFWCSIYRMRRAGDNGHLPTVAVSLMLLSYALTVGIVVSRVPQFGWDYLYQPRYVVFYQIGTVAVVLLMHHRVTTSIASCFSSRIEASFIAVVVAILLCTQVAVSISSWQLVPYLTSYWQNTSFALGKLAVNPELRPEQCPQNYGFCNFEPARRAELIRILSTHNLNVFSPMFQMRNRLYPYEESVPGLVEGESQ